MNKVKRYFLKYRLNIASGVTLFLALIAILSIYYSLEVRVTSNDECLWLPKKDSKDSLSIVFDKVKIDGVTYNAGIRDGDLLLRINKIELKSTNQAQGILDEIKSGEYADYTIKKPDGSIVETKVYVKKLIQFGSLAAAISGLLYLLIGFLVYSANPDGLAQKLFFSIGILGVLSATHILFPLNNVYFLNFITGDPLMAAFAGTIIISSQTAIPFVSLFFAWSFPKPFKFSQKKITKIIILSTVIFLSILGIGLAASIGLTNMASLKYFTMYQKIFNFLIIGLFITSAVFLILQYYRAKNTENKKPVLIFVLAFSFGLLIQFYVSTIAPAITDTIFNSPEFYMPVVLIAIVPICYAYAILKYQLLDVSVVVRNTIIYGAAMATVAGIYFVVIYLLGQGIGSFVGKENQGIVAGIFFLIFAFIFQSTKDRFQDFLTRKFYPEQFAYQKVLIQFSKDVSTVVGTEKILDITSDTFIDALKINKFGILLKDFSRDVLFLARGIGFINTECQIEKSNLISVINQKSLVTDYPVIEQQDFETAFPGKSQRLIDEDIHSIIPMIVKSKVVGALLFGLKYSGSKFGGKDLELLNAAANQIAVALENARLYKTESEKIKIERDLDLARKIQQGLLPKCIPNLSGLDICGEMIPAMQVGGDYYDLIPISDSKLFVAVGDVSGKGLSASLYMTKLQTMIQIAAKISLSPKDILIEINKRLYESMERNWFITMTLALFDMETRTVKLCRAGHLPLLTTQNGTVESIKSDGIGLGLEKGDMFEKTLKEVEIKIKPQQVFAFFSDGITEAMNEKEELFTEEKLIQILRGKSTKHSSEIMNDVLQEIISFRGTAEQNDDMTMVIVKVTK